MRVNAREYNLANDKEPVEVQKFDKYVVNVYYMNDFEGLYTTNIPRGKFILWSSVDGINYRLYVEKGYYEKLRELYSPEINLLWLNFWDECDKISKNNNVKVMLPTLVITVVGYIALMFIPFPENLAMLSTIIGIALIAIFIIVMMSTNRRTTAACQAANKRAMDGIKQSVGEAHFDELMEVQKNYIEEFYKEQERQAAIEYEKQYGRSMYEDETNINDEVVENTNNIIEEKPQDIIKEDDVETIELKEEEKENKE